MCLLGLVVAVKKLHRLSSQNCRDVESIAYILCSNHNPIEKYLIIISRFRLDVETSPSEDLTKNADSLHLGVQQRSYQNNEFLSKMALALRSFFSYKLDIVWKNVNSLSLCEFV